MAKEHLKAMSKVSHLAPPTWSVVDQAHAGLQQSQVVSVIPVPLLSAAATDKDTLASISGSPEMSKLLNDGIVACMLWECDKEVDRGGRSKTYKCRGERCCPEGTRGILAMAYILLLRGTRTRTTRMQGINILSWIAHEPLSR